MLPQRTQSLSSGRLDEEHQIPPLIRSDLFCLNVHAINLGEEYKSQISGERSDAIREIFLQNDVELEVAEGMGIDTSLLAPIHETGEEFEVQIDVDREDEGGDDMDDDGDYREN